MNINFSVSSLMRKQTIFVRLRMILFFVIIVTAMLAPALPVYDAQAAPQAGGVPDWVADLGEEDYVVGSADSLKADLPTENLGQSNYAPAYSAPVSSYAFQGNLEIEPIAAYNFIVDSNVLSPSSYGPSAATLGAKYCNRNTQPMTNVWAYIGDKTLNKPGVYPIRNQNTPGFSAAHPFLVDSTSVNNIVTDYGGSTFSLEHEGGSVGKSDASRYIGDLAPGECRVEYWLVSYPRKALVNGSWTSVTGGSIKPNDDLWLQYDLWGNANVGATTYTSSYTRYVTMRNEISAMANKIWPNGDNKVPDEYVNAIKLATGWSTWTPGGTGVAYPGQTATSQGIWYDFGNVGAGFDNNYDLIPDRNAWVQPIGDAGAYDPGCFRLVKTYGVVIVKLNDGSNLLIPFVDQMYFENIPENNTGAVGLVYYEYAALDGACSAGLTPYQEVASGYDNEKFNADFGAGIPPLQSQEPNMTITKTGPDSVGTSSDMVYKLKFAFPASTSSSMTISVGSPSVGMPLVFSDAIPAGLAFKSANPVVTMTDYSVSSITANMLYSTDSGATWSSTAPTVGTISDPANNKQIIIQWWLPTAIQQNTQTNGKTVYGEVTFTATSPSATNPPPYVENTGCLKLGNGPSFSCSTKTTLITGLRSISGTVFCDDGTQASGSGPCNTGSAAGTLGNGTLDAGGGEPGIPTVAVYLYFDSNNNGTWDSTDLLVNSTKVTDASGIYTFDQLPDNSTFFTKVVLTDSHLQSGYGITTPNIRKAAITTSDITAAQHLLDFGFAPPLVLSKARISAQDAYPGEIVTFQITPTNTLPGDGDGSGTACTYRLWAGNANQTGGTPPSGGPSNAQFSSPVADATGYPDGIYTRSNMANNADTLGLYGFYGNQGGTIQSVKVIVYLKEVTDLVAGDAFIVRPYWIPATSGQIGSDSDALTGGNTFYGNNSNFSGGSGTSHKIVYDITSLASNLPAKEAGHPASWLWTDFQGKVGIQLAANGTAKPGDVGIDAVAFEISTNQICSTDATTLNPVPLTDDFNNTELEFLSSEPPISSQNTVGSTTTLKWDNVGPLYPGQSKNIFVSFKAKAVGVVTTSTDTATSTGSKFSNGLPANTPVTDTATVILHPTVTTYSLSGVVWDDQPTVNGWVNPNGYEASDLRISNVEVALWACVDPATGNIIPNPAPGNAAKPCTDSSNAGTWKKLSVTYTDAIGAYGFTNLRPGYYRTIVNASTVVGGIQTADPNVKPGLCTAGTTCDNQSNDESPNLNALLGALSTANITNINFGYNWPNTTTSTVGDTLYYDWNGDGVQTISLGEAGIPNVDVYLYRLSDLASASPTPYLTTTTNASGRYCFGGAADSCATPTGGLPAGVYVIKIKTDDSDFPFSKVFETQDPDEASLCVTCDSTSYPSLNGTNPNLVQDFGYKPFGLGQIGDTLFYDKNGDQVQLGQQEVGIPNITIKLQMDINSNGTWVDVPSKTTDASGKYLFTGLPDGRYRVTVDTTDTDFPDNLTASTPTIYEVWISGGVATNLGAITTPSSCAVDCSLNADFGFVSLAAIGDTVYWDSNTNGTQDVGEVGINGVTVELHTFTDGPVLNGLYDPGDTYIDVNGNGYYDTGDTFVADVAGNNRYDPGETISGIVRTTTTATSLGQAGKYSFEGLSPNNYVVVVSKTGPIASADLTGDPNTDGVVCPTTAPLNIVCDNRDGMKLYYGSVYMGADFGYKPKVTIGDTLWIDTDGDNTRDAGEPGLWDIPVKLCLDAACSAGKVVNTTYTDSNGQYYFSTKSDGSALDLSTTYYVVPDTGTNWPSGLGTTPTYEGDGSKNNNITVTVAADGTVSIAGCSSNCAYAADFGYQYASGSYSISGTVCRDGSTGTTGLCGSGTSGVDADELAYGGVAVSLYRVDDANTNGKYDVGETIIFLSSVTTSAGTGDYLFTNLAANTGNFRYWVGIGSPEDYLATTTTTGILGSPTTGFNPVGVLTNLDSANNVMNITAATVPTGSTINRDFAFTSTLNYDFGDLPSSYKTTLTAGGARHVVKSTPDLYLGTGAGTHVNTEIDARGVNAVSDGYDDGVTFSNVDTWANGSTITNAISVDVVGSGWLVGWMDFNRNGAFDLANEFIVNQAVTTGNYKFNLTIPAGTFAPGGDVSLYSRFRLFPEKPATPSIAYSGEGSNGEVEDYVNSWKMTVDKDTTTPTVSANGEVIYTISIANTGTETLKDIQAVENLDAVFGSGKYTVTSRSATSGLTVNALFDGSTNKNLLAGTDTLAAGASKVITIKLNLINATQGTTFDNTVSAYSLQTGTIDDDGLTANDPGTPDAGKSPMPTTPADPETDEDVTISSLGSIGDYVWNDVNGDGVQDLGESGINGVTVALWQDTDNNGLVDPAVDTLIGTQVTANNGSNDGAYIFSSVSAGDYLVKIVSGIPAGYIQTTGTTNLHDVTLAAGLSYVNADFGYRDYNPALTLTKSASPVYYDATGDSITYEYLVTNSGGVTLSGPFTVLDNKAASVSCPATASLAPSASITCSVTYSITAGDVTNKSVTNIAQAFAGNPTPALTMEKTAKLNTTYAAGNTVAYSYSVTNTGNVALTSVTVSDDKASVTCPAFTTVGDLDAVFDPGESMSCSATYTLLVGDVTAGFVTNTATASGTNGTVTTPIVKDKATVTRSGIPAMTLEKSVSPTGYMVTGQVITYSYKITNTGNVSLTGITLTDDKAKLVSCPATSLATSASMTCTASYVITAGDVTTGSVTNTATADSDQTGPVVDIKTIVKTPVKSNTDTKTVDLVALTIDKDTTTVSAETSGTVTYKIVVTNTGKATLNNLQVTDTLPDFKPTDLASKGYAVSNVVVATTDTTTFTANFTAGTPPTGFDGDQDKNLLTGSNSLSAGKSLTITITLTLNSAENGTYDNTAAVTSTEITTPVDDDGLTANDPGTPDAGKDPMPTTPADPETDEDVTVSTNPFISGNVSADTDNDNTGDTNLSGITIELYADADGDGVADSTTPVATKQTDTNGNYNFPNVTPGKYVVVETNGSSYPNDVSDKDGSANGTNLNTIKVDVSNGTSSTGNDFVDKQNTYTISGTVYDDNTGTVSGDFDTGDKPIGSVKVELFADDGSGAPTGTALYSKTTDGTTGLYSFTGVVPGKYVVVETDPSGYTSVTDINGNTTNPDYNRIPVNLTNADSTGNDFLDKQNTYTISGTVYDDNTGTVSGDFDTGDNPIGSVTVELFADDGTGAPTGTALYSKTTDGTTGLYSFTSVVPGKYVVVETDPSGYTSVKDIDGNTTNPGYNRIPVNLTNADSTGNDFLDKQNTYTISGTVYDDNTGTVSGDFDTGDKPIGSVTVELFTDDGTGAPTGTALYSTTTDVTTGAYSFTSVVPGDYVVVETDPSGYISVKDIDGDTVDPNYNRIPVNLTNADSTGNDFLDKQTSYTISGKVFDDNTGTVSGDFDTGDDPIGSVTVELFADDGSGAPTGKVVDSTTTDGTTGLYSFTGVAPGKYVVVETDPSGYTSVTDINGDTGHPDYNRIPVDVTNANVTGRNFLDKQNTYTISGTVYDDNTGTVSGDFDTGDNPIGSVTVELFADDGTGAPKGTALYSTTTDGTTGLYSFTGVVPGDYVVVETDPSGYTSVTDINGNTTNPDYNRIPVNLTNADSTGNDFLDKQNTYTISGTVYDDNAGTVSGDFDTGDDPIGSVTVELFADDGTGAPTGTALYSKTTDGTRGLYSFTSLVPGKYVVVETDPSGYTSIKDIDGDTASPAYNRIPVNLTNADSTGNDFLDKSVSGTAQITVTKTIKSVTFINPDVFRATYEITITNSGSVTLNNIQATDSLSSTFVGAASFSVVSVTSTDFTVNPGYNGRTNTNLLTLTGNSLASGNSGVILLVAEANTGGDADNYTNLVAVSGIPESCANPVDAQDSLDVMFGDCPTVTDTDQYTGPSFVDPAVTKVADVKNASVGDPVTFTITVTNHGNQTAQDVLVVDPLPEMFDVVSATSTPRGTVTITGRVVEVNIGDLASGDEIIIKIHTVVNNNGQLPAENTVQVKTSSTTDVVKNNTDTVKIGNPSDKADVLPATGFAPDIFTALPLQPKNMAYASQDMTVEIPRLGVSMPVVGVPQVDKQWDVTWLGNQAGWLNGTAFPTWAGNSVITGHVYLSNGKPGPFRYLSSLRWGDQVIIHAFGQKYIYEVRNLLFVSPNNASIISHEEQPWLTLLTCKDYDEKSNTYKTRVAVKAVLVKVVKE
jgi:LPXTG-site transpeptidase (sortase) family protein